MLPVSQRTVPVQLPMQPCFRRVLPNYELDSRRQVLRDLFSFRVEMPALPASEAPRDERGRRWYPETSESASDLNGFINPSPLARLISDRSLQ